MNENGTIAAVIVERIHLIKPKQNIAEENRRRTSRISRKKMMPGSKPLVSILRIG